MSDSLCCQASILKLFREIQKPVRKKRAFTCQDYFVRLREREVTKSNEQVKDVEVGWYTEDDMMKVLKWNKSLGFKLYNIASTELEI